MPRDGTFQQIKWNETKYWALLFISFQDRKDDFERQWLHLTRQVKGVGSSTPSWLSGVVWPLSPHCPWNRQEANQMWCVSFLKCLQKKQVTGTWLGWSIPGDLNLRRTYRFLIWCRGDLTSLGCAWAYEERHNKVFASLTLHLWVWQDVNPTFSVCRPLFVSCDMWRKSEGLWFEYGIIMWVSLIWVKW